MNWDPQTRRHLVKHVWPDKLLYGSIMLTIAGLLGFVQALITLLVPVAFAENLAPVLAGYPGWLTLALSFATLVFGLMAWRRLSIVWGFLGASTGIASLSLFGIGSLHAVAAFAFVAFAAHEGEHKVHPGPRLTRFDWPDKAFAASLLLLMAGMATFAWGVGILVGQVAWGPAPLAWGTAQIIAGALAIVTAAYLYRERAPILGITAALFCSLTFAAYFLAPGLAIAAVVAIALGWREGEFRPTAPADRGVAASAPPRTP